MVANPTHGVQFYFSSSIKIKCTLLSPKVYPRIIMKMLLQHGVSGGQLSLDGARKVLSLGIKQRMRLFIQYAKALINDPLLCNLLGVSRRITPALMLPPAPP